MYYSEQLSILHRFVVLLGEDYTLLVFCSGRQGQVQGRAFAKHPG